MGLYPVPPLALSFTYVCHFLPECPLPHICCLSKSCLFSRLLFYTIFPMNLFWFCWPNVVFLQPSLAPYLCFLAFSLLKTPCSQDLWYSLITHSTWHNILHMVSLSELNELYQVIILVFIWTVASLKISGL
jgi:hypothetical protein